MYFTKTPPLLKQFARDLIWKIPTEKNELFLTFDDGPVKGVTDEILNILDTFNAKATFFCVGENAKNNPELLADIRARGHGVGNHTFSHSNGWKSSTHSYLKDYIKCREIIGSDEFFRPPYGRISPGQIQALKGRTKIIMWDVLSADFDLNLDPERCVHNVVSKTQKGSIIVMHDSQKSKRHVLYALPKILTHFNDYSFLSLNDKIQ